MQRLLPYLRAAWLLYLVSLRAKAYADELPHIRALDLDTRVAARLNVTTDYAQATSLLYPADNGRQIRTSVGVTARVSPYVLLGAQYRALESWNDYVYATGNRNFGDSVLWATGVYPHDEKTAVGATFEYRYYTGIPNGGGAATLLGARTAGPFGLHASAGWHVERTAAIFPRNTPYSAFASQKASLNSWAFALAARYTESVVEPFAVYSLQHYVGASLPTIRQPQRVSFGASVPAPRMPLRVIPSVDFAVRRPVSSLLPADPPWRAGVELSYELPVRAWWRALFPPPGTLVGVVSDVLSKGVIPNLEVRVDNVRIPCSEGKFEFTGPPGSYSVMFTAPAYLPSAETITIEPEKLIAKRFLLQRNRGFLMGTVFLADKPGEAYYAMNGGVTHATAQDGSFINDIPPGDYALSFTAPGFRPETRSVTIQIGGSINFRDIHLRPLHEDRSEGFKAAPALEESAGALPPATPPAIEDEREWREWKPPETPGPAASFDSPVFFEFGSEVVDPRALPSLQRLADYIRANGQIERVVIEGRADVSGGETVNLQVAAGRAQAVLQILVERGVPQNKLATTKTIYDRKAVDQSPKQRALDRKVGFRIEILPE